MKTQEQWFSEYAESHQNPTNQIVHYICVPLIFWSIIGLFVSIPNDWLMQVLGTSNPYIANWALILIGLTSIFYLLNLKLKNSILVIIFALACMDLSVYLQGQTNLLYLSIGVFIIAWIGQFWGHSVEGKKPSFLKDLQFLLIGPAWVFEKWTRNKK